MMQDLLDMSPALLGMLTFVGLLVAAVLWYDHRHGNIYQRRAREIEAHSAALRARREKPQDKEI